MIVIYRLCGIPSTNPSPIFQEDKYRLNELCLRSFVKAFKYVNPKMYFIADHCDHRYEEMVKRIVSFEFDFELTNMGINETCLYQYRLFEESGEEEVLFQECDYLWIGDGQRILDGLRELPYVSPYDHPDKYPSESVEIKLINEQHWRSAPSTTATFATNRENFLKNKDLFNKWGYLDKARWEEMGKGLYTPIPSLATHLVVSQLAPGIDWKGEYEAYI